MYSIRVLLSFTYIIWIIIADTVEGDTNDQLYDCWTTGCQPDTWAVVGCEQYEKTEVDKYSCQGGYEYHCCSENEHYVAPTTTPAPNTFDLYVDCWTTGCQPDTWAVVGCEQYEMTEVDKFPCLEGEGYEYKCCIENEDYVPDPASVEWYSDCSRTGCQSTNDGEVGCAQYMKTEMDRFPCPAGYEYECCVINGRNEDLFPAPNSTNFDLDEYLDDLYKPIDQESNLPEYIDYIKGLLLSSGVFALDADPFPCTDIDPTKQYVVQDGDTAIRICDLCPFFPFEKLSNLFLNINATFIWPNTVYIDCVSNCLEQSSCVALSHDSEENICYGFNTTEAETFDEINYTTVIVTQPKGMIRDWLYSRNTKLVANSTNSFTATSFVECLDRCSKSGINDCTAVSFEYSTKSCQFFNVSTFDRVDYAYGHLAALNVNITQGAESNRWRFSSYNNLMDEQTDDAFATGNFPNEEFGSFYNPSCQLQPSLSGCDQFSGFQKCYYPEYSGSTHQLPICQDSRYKSYESIELQNALLEKCMTECAQSGECRGVDFSKDDSSCTQLDYENIMKLQLAGQKPFILVHPIHDNVVVKNFNLFFGTEILQSVESAASIIKSIQTSNEMACAQSCNTTTDCGLASYNWITRICVLARGATDSKMDSNAITFSRMSELTSPKLGFVSLFSTGIEGSEIQTAESECSQPNCQPNVDACLSACLGNTLCKFVGITYLYKAKTQLVCAQYETDNTFIKWNSRQEVYVRVAGSISLGLADMDNMSVFQSNDFWSCFRQSARQTQSSLQTLANDDVSDSTNHQSTEVSSVRRKRGFFSAIGNFFKNVAKAVVSVVEDVVQTVVKTGETVAKVVTGDFKGALETVQEIPIVKDVKNIVETGIEIVGNIKDGNWEDIGKNVLDIGIGAVGLIPGPGKIGGKIVSKAIGKQTTKNTAKNVDVKATNNAKKKNADNKKDTEKEKETTNNDCKKRTRRAAAKNKPGTAKKDSCDAAKCSALKVTNIKSKFKENCNNKKVGEHCEFICNAGYTESDVSPKCTERNNSPLWNPELKCEAQKCTSVFGSGDFPVRVKAYRKMLTNIDINSYFIKFDKRRSLPIYSASFHDMLQQQTGNLVSNFEFNRDDQDFTKHPCTQLASSQPNKPTDFKMTPDQAMKSGTKTAWDRGHLTPFQAQSFSYKSAITSNLFVNVAPQDPFTNQAPWSSVERFVFCLLKGQNNGIVITGVCDSSSAKTLTGIKVPDCFWKLVCYKDPTDETVVIGFLAENSIVHSLDQIAKTARTDATQKFRSQREIIQTSKVDMLSEWSKAAKYIFEGRKTTGIFNPPRPDKCATAMNLPSLLPTWEKNSKKRKIDDVSRKKRAVTYGCSAESMLETLALFDEIGSPNSGDEDDSESQNEHEFDEDEESGVGNSFSGASCGKRLIGYYPSWGTSRFTNVQGRALTHAVFAFFQTFEDGTIRLGTADPTNTKNAGEDLEVAKTRLANFKRIASAFSSMKTMFAIGGWENSNYFSGIASDPQKRLKLIASILGIIDDHDFDGVDIDWEHPVTGGAVEGIPADKQNYVTLLEEIRNAFNEHETKTGRSEHLLISFAGAAGQWTLDPGLDLPNMLKFADFANVMSYDYFGAWTSKWGAYTGPPSPLYFGNPKGFSGKVNADWSVKYYVCRTKEPHKVNMGVPFYGRFWKNVGDPIDPNDGMWRMAEQVNGIFEGGFVPWKEIKDKWISDPGFKVTMHEKAKTPYAWNAATKTFLGFENPESLAFKVQYAEEMNLGGLMIWAIDQDDEDYSMLDTLLQANLCKETDSKKINHRCPPITEKRWWTPEDGYDKAGMCGKSAPLFQGFYPVCDPDDPGYSCCGAFGYCGSGKDFCDCPTCVDYLTSPDKILNAPIKPTVPVNWYFLNDADGKRGRCGRDAPLLNNKIPICNPDDVNGHCCSNGGYCGASKDFCECDECIDFAKNPNYVFKPKTWWSWSDGADKAGKCGESAPKIDGKVAECDPDSKDSYCCSEWGNCGEGSDFCDCSKCVNYKKR